MNLCGTAIAALFVFGTTSGFAAQVEKGTESAECKGIVARLLAATDETFDHYSPSGENVFFRNRKGVLSCTSYRHASISFTWDTVGFPPDEWFGLLAKAGKAVTGADLNRLISASRECYRSALKASTELADIEIANAKIECQAFAFDNGKMNISIRMNDGVLPLLDER
jgi:hypothetical protein